MIHIPGRTPPVVTAHDAKRGLYHLEHIQVASELRRAPSQIVYHFNVFYMIKHTPKPSFPRGSQGAHDQTRGPEDEGRLHAMQAEPWPRRTSKNARAEVACACVKV